MNQNLNKFIPKVLLLGNENEIPNDLPKFEIVGKIELRQLEPNVIQLLFEGKPLSESKLKSLDFDYVLFPNDALYFKNRKLFGKFLRLGILATNQFFRCYVSNVGFTAQDNLDSLYKLISKNQTKSPQQILDLDAYIYRSGAYEFPSPYQVAPPPQKIFQIETILENPSKIEPIFRNVYDSIFTSFEEIKLRSYDSILLTAERSTEDLLMLIDWAEKSSKNIFIFLHCNSPTLKAMKQISIGRKNMNWTPALRGEWLEISIKRDDSCKAYVVMHKKYFLPKLPSGYEIIHAGKKNSTIDLGFQGDDTGDNISDLNLYLNELTVTYWAWKNAPRTDYIGFAHYERFFMLPDSETTDRSPENYTPIKRKRFHVLTMQDAIDLLQDCDILVRKINFSGGSIRVKSAIPSIQWEIAKKTIEQNIPDSLSTLYLQNAGMRFISNSMFFTRWKVFDEYCKWMFSWAVPAARECIPHIGNGYKRNIGMICEEMSQVFMMKNNLRIKYLPVFIGDKESTPEKPIF